MLTHCYDLEVQAIDDFYVDDVEAPIRLSRRPKPQTVQIWLNSLRMTEVGFDPGADLASLLPLKEGDTVTVIYNVDTAKRT